MTSGGRHPAVDRVARRCRFCRWLLRFRLILDESATRAMKLRRQLPTFRLRFQIAFIAVLLSLLAAESMAGHFRRYPRLANGAKADAVGGWKNLRTVFRQSPRAIRVSLQKSLRRQKGPETIRVKVPSRRMNLKARTVRRTAKKRNPNPSSNSISISFVAMNGSSWNTSTPAIHFRTCAAV